MLVVVEAALKAETAVDAEAVEVVVDAEVPVDAEAAHQKQRDLERWLASQIDAASEIVP